MKIRNFNVGYACVNVHLAEQGIRASRDIRKDTFAKMSLEEVSKVILSNVRDQKKIVEWNNEHEIKFYRMSSGIFPWMSEYEIEELPQIDEISRILKETGDIARNAGQRLSFHPGPFVVLASPHGHVRHVAKKELEKHSQIMDLMGLERSTWNKINIHIGGAYGDKEKAIERWKKTWEDLSEGVKSRLAVENDDKASMYSARDLYEMLHKSIGISVTFDSFHHDFCTGGLSKEDAALLSASTWKSDPAFHFASSLRLNENSGAMKTAHADWIHEELTDWGTGAWIMVEAKAKELSILHYKNNGAGKPVVPIAESNSLYTKFSHEQI
jgi:UV DNA damage endonuclease